MPIAKNVADPYWESFFEEDPKKVGVSLALSVGYRELAREKGVKIFYEDLREAVKDCEELSKLNPSAGYGVCPVRE